MNTLFPIFLKLDQLEMLLVGGGPVGLEKLSALLRNSPKANITLVAETVLPEIYELAAQYPQVQIFVRSFHLRDLDGKNLVILAANNRALHEAIVAQAHERNILVNVADTPDLCDFYLSAVAQRGDLKIAISTNGKSPTLAKRLREHFEQELPEQMQELLDNLRQYRGLIGGDFAHKVAALNALTADLIERNN